MIALLSAQQIRELRTRGLTDCAIDSFDTMLGEMREYLLLDPQDRRARKKRLRKIAAILAKAAAALEEADNVSLARMQAHAMGPYPKTSITAHELGIAIRSFSKGADTAASEFDGKGPKRGPDRAFSSHVARTALTIL